MRTDTPVPVKLSEYQPYPFEVEQVSLVFTLNPDQTRVVAEMQVKRTGAGDMVLDGETLTLNSVAVNGNALSEADYTLTPSTLTLHDLPESFTLETDVFTSPSKNTALSGLYMSGGRFCTQCEAIGFRRITFYPDRPDVMSRFHVRIEAEKAAYPILLSNGTPGEAGDLDGGRHFANWDDPHPKPSYLFALCAGDYDVYTDRFTTMTGKDIDLAIHVDKGDAQRAAWAMDSLKRSMKWDEDVFAREYDLGVFNIVAVRDFNFGAMENKGLNIFNSAYVLADEAAATDADFEAIESIVAHEYFHNWTGNRITCRDWFQLCLKEGLTVFRDQEFSADMRSRPVQRIKDVIRLRARQFPEDAGPLAHPVRPAAYGAIDNLYTATVYEKGSELIRMLKTMIGDAAFAKGMQIYFDRHDGDASTIEDFYACFEDASGKDLKDFMRWYNQPGTPHISFSESFDAAAGSYTARFTQRPGKADAGLLPVPLKLAAFAADGTKLAEEMIVLEGETADWTIPASEKPALSVNREFGAPIRVEDARSVDERLTLARLDDDPFNKWDTFQALMKADLVAATYEGHNGNPDLIDALASAVEDAAKSDPAYAALLARLPSVGELMLEHTPADPAALAEARKTAKQALATRLAGFSKEILGQASPTPFDPGAEQAGIRALRGSAIDLTGALGDAATLLGIYQAANDMTEELTALRTLAELEGTVERDEALSDFYAKWSSNQLVLDKWFAAQAATGDAKTVDNLTKHADFDLKNPNRVRALVGVFSAQNLGAFHAPDGSGHALLASFIQKADAINPALAARLASAFEQWRTLEEKAQASAKSAMETLMSGELSKNTADILSRALGASS